MLLAVEVGIVLRALMGFDFCVGENAAKQPVKPERRGGSLWGLENPSAKFNGGMCVGRGERGVARARYSRAKDVTRSVSARAGTSSRTTSTRGGTYLRRGRRA